MSSRQYRSSKPDQWTLPRPYTDASLRYMKHGPIVPLDEPGFSLRESLASLGRLFAR